MYDLLTKPALSLFTPLINCVKRTGHRNINGVYSMKMKVGSNGTKIAEHHLLPIQSPLPSMNFL